MRTSFVDSRAILATLSAEFICWLICRRGATLDAIGYSLQLATSLVTSRQLANVTRRRALQINKQIAHRCWLAVQMSLLAPPPAPFAERRSLNSLEDETTTNKFVDASALLYLTMIVCLCDTHLHFT